MAQNASENDSQRLLIDRRFVQWTACLTAV